MNFMETCFHTSSNSMSCEPLKNSFLTKSSTLFQYFLLIALENSGK